MTAICAFIGLCARAAGSAPVDSVSLQGIEVVGQPVERAVEASAPVRVLDSERMLREGATSVADAVHRLPGVTLRDYGGAGGLKTVSVRGFGAAHTAVAYDGMPLSDAQTGQIDLSRFSIDNAASLSLAVGDNDDIFIPARAASAASVLSIATPMPSARADAVAQLRVGSWGSVNPYLRLGTPIGTKASLSVTGEYTYAKNDYPFKLHNGTLITTERRSNSRMRSGHAEANFSLRSSAASSLTAKAYYFDSDRRLPGPVIYYNNVSHEALRERQAFWQGRYRTALSDRWLLMANAKYSFASSFYSDQSGKYPGGRLGQRYWQREWYGSGSLMWLPSQSWALCYSSDYAYANLNSTLPSDCRPRRQAVLQSAAARYRTSRVTAMVRALYSGYFNGAKAGTPSRDASRLSPSASMSVKPLEGNDFYVRASYKNIFRMPTFSEAYFDHYGSDEVLPETTDQFNLGLTFQPRPLPWLASASATVDAYVNRVRDMIVAVPVNMFVWRMTNLGRVTVVGVDAAVNAEFVLASRQSLFLSGNYSFQRAMPRTYRQSLDWMKQVAYIPRHSGSVALSWENQWVCLSANCVFVSERFTSNNNSPATRIAGYAEFGLGAWRAFALRGHAIELRVNVLNLFNKQYSVVANYPMPGRSWQASIRFEL